MSFTENMQKLQEILGRYEKDDLTLESALFEYEKGIALIRECDRYLRDAKQTVLTLSEETTLQAEIRFDEKEGEY